MSALLDVNALIALAWPNHVHHILARDWFRRRSAAGWATCSATQTGFVRVSSNRAAIPEARVPSEARDMLRQIVNLPGHEFWTDDVAFANTEWIDDAKLLGHRQVTDAHLLALAIRHSGSLATLDRGVLDLVPHGFEPDQILELLL
jgi:toxin-antitoxin system PIN domain toxin